MEPKLLRLAYIAEFLLALIAVFSVWSQVGGQTHLDLMAWYFKLFFGVAMAYAVVRATRAAVESERAWNGRVLRWLTLVAVLAVGAGVITYYYHVYEPRDEEDQPTTQTSIVPEKPSRAADGAGYDPCTFPEAFIPSTSPRLRAACQPDVL